MDIAKLHFKTDAEWRKADFAWADGAEFLIAPAGNDAFRKKLEQLERPYKKRILRGTLDQEKRDEIFLTAFAGTVLLDWRGLTDNGQPYPFSEKNAVALMTAAKPLLNEIGSMSLEQAQEAEEISASADDNIKK